MTSRRRTRPTRPKPLASLRAALVTASVVSGCGGDESLSPIAPPVTTSSTSTTGSGGTGGGEPVAGSAGAPLCMPADDLPPSASPTRWRSHLVGADWRPGDTDGQGRFVHDFSYAGYHFGETSWPSLVEPVVDVTAPPYSADPTGQADSTAPIQQALDDVGESGGGTVLLPAGTYRVLPPDDTHQVLRIRHSRVVLRGAGRGETFLFNDATRMTSGSVILIRPDEPSDTDWFDPVGESVPLAVDGKNGSDRIMVEDASSFTEGERIVVKANATAEWIAEHGMTGLWNPGGGLIGPTFMRRARAVAGNEITLDAPLRYPVLVRDAGRVYHPPVQLEEVGLADFSIGMREHPGTTGWGDQDYDVAGTSANDVAYSAAIRMVHVENGWIDRVSSYQPPSNSRLVHLLSHGVVVDQSRAITLRDVLMQHPQYEGGGGNGYTFILQGNEVLADGCASVSARHAYSMSNGSTSGNVVRRSSSTDSRFATDFHRFLTTGNLLEQLVLDADWIDATYRPWGTVIHGYSTTQSVFWNVYGRRYHSAGSFVVDSRQFDWGLVIGTRGPAPSVQTTPLVISNHDTAPEDWHEGDGASGTLEPASLYEDQLYRRLHAGDAPPRDVPMWTLGPSEDAFVRDGAHASENYGSEPSLQIKDSAQDWARRALLKFDLTAVTRPIARATLVLRGVVSDQDGTRSLTGVRAVADDSWSEASLTWSNQPAIGEFLARRLVTDEAGEWAFDVTEFVRAEQRKDHVASLALTQSLGGGGYLVVFDSRESDGTPPRLELVPVDRAPIAVAAVTGDEAAPDTSIDAVIDGDYGTRWSNETFGASLTLDVGLGQPVTGLGVALYQGADRIQFLEVQTSEDGETWTTRLAGQAAGFTDELQRFFFEPVIARYVRFVGFGNSKNGWNSITEIEIYGC